MSDLCGTCNCDLIFQQHSHALYMVYMIIRNWELSHRSINSSRKGCKRYGIMDRTSGMKKEGAYIIYHIFLLCYTFP